MIEVDVLVVTETKSASNFPTSQFYTIGFTKPDRLDRNRDGRWVLIYIGVDIIPSKLLENHLLNDIQGCYLPPSQSDNSE